MSVRLPSTGKLAIGEQHVVRAAVQEEVLVPIADLAHARHSLDRGEHIGPGHFAGRLARGILHVEAEANLRVRPPIGQVDSEVTGEGLLDGLAHGGRVRASAQEHARVHIDDAIDRILHGDHERERAGIDHGHLMEDLLLERLRRETAALRNHEQNAAVLADGAVLVRGQHERPRDLGQAQGVVLKVLARDRAVQRAQRCGRAHLGRSQALPRHTAARRCRVLDRHVDRIPERIGKGPLEDDDALGIDVALGAAAGLVAHADRASRDRALQPVPEAHRGAVVLVHEHEEVAVAGPGVEKALDLGEGAVARRDFGRAIQERRERQRKRLVREPRRT